MCLAQVCYITEVVFLPCKVSHSGHMKLSSHIAHDYVP